MKRPLLAAALALPLAVLGAIWVTTHHSAQQGQEWLVPITGYDPRDLLRGHYVRYRYQWPVDDQSQDARSKQTTLFNPAYASSLCIEGKAPDIVRVRETTSFPTRHCSVIVRAGEGTRREVSGLDQGIFYASQDRVLSLSRSLADPTTQGYLRVRIRPDGMMRPVDLEVRAKGAR